MKITYLHHSGFLVELESTVWVFDYETGELPEFDQDKPLYLCVSHSHPDHYNPEIFTRFPQAKQFLLARQIRRIPELPSILRLAQNRTYTLPDAVIHTLKSTDAGVAFVVEADGKCIYHAGDLNWWSWPDDTPEETRVMRERFWIQLEKLRGMHFDAAFLPLDPRLQENFALGFDAFLRTAEAQYVFPMHFWDDYSVIDRVLALPCSAPYRTRIMRITHPNQTFLC